MLALPFKIKKNWLLIAGVILAITLIPVGFATAALWTQALAALPSLIVTLVVQLLLTIADFGLRLANGLLKWTASGGIFSYSATNPANNEVIRIGWTLLRDITNTLFVIGLAYIGLMTALDLGKFETKKTFSRLLIIAVFINFSPVLCGVIVDFANIISGYFLQGTDFSQIVEIFSTQRELLWKHKLDMVTNGSILLQTIMLIGFGIMSAGILLLFAALFFVRHPALWILVILSPIMFFFWVFEKTQGWVKTWWSQFLQWSFIVLPASFFIYLSQHAVLLAQNMISTQIQGENPGGDVFSQISPYFVAIVFLVFGLMMALKINAMGTGAIMRNAKAVKDRASTYGKKAFTKPVSLAATGLATGAAVGSAAAIKGLKHQWDKRVGPPLKPGQEGYEDWSKKHRTRAGLGKASRYVMGGETQEERERWNKGWRRVGRRAVQTAAVVGTGVASGGIVPAAAIAGKALKRKAGAAIEASDQAKIAEAGKEVGGMTDKQLIDAVLSAKRPTKQVGLIQEAIKQGRYSDIKDQVPEYVLKGIFNDAIRLGSGKSTKTFTNADPNLMAKVLDEKNTRKKDLEATDAAKQMTDVESKIAEKTADLQELINTKAPDAKVKAANRELDELRTQRETLDRYQKTRTDYDSLAAKQKGGTITDEERVEMSKKESEIKKDLRILGQYRSTIADEQYKKLGLGLSDGDSKKLAEFNKKAAKMAKDAADNGDFEAKEALENWDKKKVKKTDENGHDYEVWEEMTDLEKKVIMNASANDAENWDKGQAGSIVKSGLFHLAAAPAVMTKLGEKFGSDMVKTFQEEMERITGTTDTKDPAKQEQFYRQIGNDRMANYLGGSAARNLGLGFSQLPEAAKKISKKIGETVGALEDENDAIKRITAQRTEIEDEVTSGKRTSLPKEYYDLDDQLREHNKRKAELERDKDNYEEKMREAMPETIKVEFKYPELQPYLQTNGEWRKGISDAEKAVAEPLMEQIFKDLEKEIEAKYLDPGTANPKSTLTREEIREYKRANAQYQKLGERLGGTP